jgi:hypothetical protein
MHTANSNSENVLVSNILGLNKRKISHLHGKLLRKLADQAIESQSINNLKADSTFSKSQFSRSNPSE